jgi:hypothetical protein
MALQVWDDLFADAGAVSHAHGAAAPGSSTAQNDVERWFAEADADGDGRQVTMQSRCCLQTCACHGSAICCSFT